MRMLSIKSPRDMSKDVHCRKAVPEDVQAVVALGKQLELREGEDPSDACSHGFLIYVKPGEAYEKRFSLSQYCSVAELDGEIVGFLIAHDAEELTAMGDLLKYPQVLKEYLFALEHPHWIYIDQIAVGPKHQKQGIGQSLYDFTFGDTKKSLLVAGNTLSPIPNEASYQFFSKNGHTLLSELKEGKWRFGMYGKEV